MAERRIVVVGGVSAGMSAASEGKRRRQTAEVEVVTPDEAVHTRGVDPRLRCEVTAIDVAGGRVEQRDHATGRDAREPFDALVFAVTHRGLRETREAA